MGPPGDPGPMGIPGIPTIILWKNSREDWLTFTVSGEPHVHPPGVLVFFFSPSFPSSLGQQGGAGAGEAVRMGGEGKCKEGRSLPFGLGLWSLLPSGSLLG